MNAADRLKEIPASCYQPKNHTGGKLVCEENGRRMVFIKASGRHASKIRVDNCVIKQGTACDYLVYDWKGRYHFVELKGRDVEGAFAQLAAAIAHFLPAGTKDEFWCFVICTKSPPTSLPQAQNAQLRLKRQWGENMTLKVRVNEYVHHLKD